MPTSQISHVICWQRRCKQAETIHAELQRIPFGVGLYIDFSILGQRNFLWGSAAQFYASANKT